MTTFDVTYQITAGATGDVVAKDVCRVSAADEAGARRAASAWVANNDCRDDHRIDPIVSILTVVPLSRFAGRFSVGPENDDVGEVTLLAADWTEAWRMLSEPCDSLRNSIEASMRARGREPEMAWHDYEAIEIEEDE